MSRKVVSKEPGAVQDELFSRQIYKLLWLSQAHLGQGVDEGDYKLQEPIKKNRLDAVHILPSERPCESHRRYISAYAYQKRQKLTI